MDMRILLVEDNEALNHSLKYQLETAGFTVDSCYDGEEALFLIEEMIHDVILLDRMLPLLSGAEVLTRIRRKGIETPVILLTALGSLEDKITGLDMGADDYLVKPFAFDELLARIRCVARRPHSLHIDDSIRVGDLTLSLSECRLAGPKSSCRLSKKENELFETFIRNAGQTLTRTMLLTKVWGLESDVEDGNLDNYIHFLRRRLKAVGSGVCIRTIRGVGYCMENRPEVL